MTSVELNFLPSGSRWSYGHAMQPARREGGGGAEKQMGGGREERARMVAEEEVCSQYMVEM